MIVFCMMLFPIGAKASNYGIEKFNMHVTILENGDLEVKEAFMMNGSFNGMNRDIYFRNSTLPIFTKDTQSLEGSDIYNGTDIELVQIRAIPYTNSISWEEMEVSGTQFMPTYSASSGDFGVYTESRNVDGANFRIFNPSSKKTFFYLEYIIKNMAVTHNDVAELAWNIFGSNFRESIHYLTIDIYIPNNKETLRAYAHGPLIGEIKLDGKEHVNLSIEGLESYTAIDTRLVFDKSVLTTQQKLSNMDAENKIVEIETEKANLANQEREKYRKQLEQEKKYKKRMTYFFTLLGFIWFIGLVILINYVYQKHDKEYDSTFKTKYFRDFPADYNPSTVGYLFHQTIRNNDLSACLLNLIYKKVVTFEAIDKKDYKLTYHENKEPLTEADQKLIKLIFREPQITLSMLKKKAKSGYLSFINDFNAWKGKATEEAEKEEFYEQKTSIKTKSSIYSIIGMILGVSAMKFTIILGILLLMSGLISLLYFILFTKKTIKGNEHYRKWKGLKAFMEDFGTINKKDLPDIVLWEKYLVYAVSLGCADKLAKTMELRIAEFNDVDLMNFNYNIHTMQDIMILNHIVSNSINTAVNNAYSAQSIASSSNSSGGGFGGGFSGGGGSFGGGSGGGRF